jgi:hypothetical protein
MKKSQIFNEGLKNSFETRHIFLKFSDISEALKGATVLVYWAEGFDMWFEGTIEVIDVKMGAMAIYYPESDETEQNADLQELIEHQWIKIKTQAHEGNKCNSDQKPRTHRETGLLSSKPSGYNIEVKGLRLDEAHSRASINTCVTSQPSEIKTHNKKIMKHAVLSKSSPLVPCHLNSQPKTAQKTAKILVEKTPLHSAINPENQLRDLVRVDLEKLLNKTHCELQHVNENIQSYRTASEIAQQLEFAMLKMCNDSVGKAYRERYRALVFNMHDQGNKELRQAIGRGLISPSRLMSMSEAELMSSSKRAELEAMESEAGKARIIDLEGAALMNMTAAEAYSEEMRRNEKGSLMNIQARFGCQTSQRKRNFSPKEKQNANTYRRKDDIVERREIESEFALERNPKNKICTETEMNLIRSLAQQFKPRNKVRKLSSSQSAVMNTSRSSSCEQLTETVSVSESVVDETSLSSLFLPSCGLGDKTDWVGIFTIPKATLEDQTMLSVRIRQLSGLGPLQAMLPGHLTVLKKVIQGSQLNAYLNQIFLSEKRTVSMGAIHATSCNTLHLDDREELIQTYLTTQSLAWTDRFCNGEKFEFHVVAAQSDVGVRLLEYAGIGAPGCSVVLPNQIGIMELLLVVIHSKEYVPTDEWIEQQLDSQSDMGTENEITIYNSLQPTSYKTKQMFGMESCPIVKKSNALPRKNLVASMQREPLAYPLRTEDFSGPSSYNSEVSGGEKVSFSEPFCSPSPMRMKEQQAPQKFGRQKFGTSVIDLKLLDSVMDILTEPHFTS